MYGVVVNVLTVLVGSIFGLLLRKGIPEKITTALMTGIGLCTVYIGIQGALTGKNTLVLILSMCIGTVIGTILNLDKKLNDLGKWVEKKASKGEKNTPVVEGFVTASMLFCIGSMTLVGCLQAGLNKDNTMLLTKATLDLISSFALSASLGVGVILAAVFVLVFQGGLVLLASFASPFLSEYTIGEMTCVGSVIIIALGFNLVGITKIKVANYFPAIFLPIILCIFMKA